MGGGVPLYPSGMLAWNKMGGKVTLSNTIAHFQCLWKDYSGNKADGCLYDEKGTEKSCC